MASHTIILSLASRPENMKDFSILSMIAFLASSLLLITIGLKSSFLLKVPNASAQTEHLGPFFFIVILAGRSST
jgi:membrane protein DedA with SNARE-associated domain